MGQKNGTYTREFRHFSIKGIRCETFIEHCCGVRKCLLGNYAARPPTYEVAPDLIFKSPHEKVCRLAISRSGWISNTVPFFLIKSCHSEHMEPQMDTATIIAELEAERNRLLRAIAALRGNRITFRKASGKPDGRKRPYSAATRRKLSRATKMRWAEWRKKRAAA